MTVQRARLRALAAAVLLVALAPTARASAQDAPAIQVLLAPSHVQAGAQPIQVAIVIENTPPLRGFEVVLEYDPEALAITGAAAGDLLAASGSTLGHQAGQPGELRLFAAVATDDAALRPQGSGALAQVTLGALAAEGRWEIKIRDIELLTAEDADGLTAADAAALSGATVEVVTPPDEAERTALVASAEAFAAQAVAPPGASASLERAFAGLRDRLGDQASAAGPLLAWAGALAAGALLALVGWWLGREARDVGSLSR